MPTFIHIQSRTVGAFPGRSKLEAVVDSLEQTVLEKLADVIKRGMSREQAGEMVRPMCMISDADA